VQAVEEPRSQPVPASTAAHNYLIDLPQQKDAAAIARCFLEVYGHHYVHSEVFSTRRYWEKVESSELIPVVARDSEGEVIGHVALEREPGMQVAERGEAVVRSAHRGHGLLERMTERLREEAPKHDLRGIYAEPLTIHTFSQRNDERAGMPVCAVLLGANPEDFRPRASPAPRWVSARATCGHSVSWDIQARARSRHPRLIGTCCSSSTPASAPPPRWLRRHRRERPIPAPASG
jgi:hypothetical protein